MSFRTGFHKGKLGIGLATSMGMDDGTGNPRYPLDINGDIRLTGAIVDASGNPIEMMAQQRSFPEAISTEDIDIGDGTAFFESNVKITGDLDFTGTLKQDGVEFGGGKFEDSATAGDIYYNGGNVGIGTTNPVDTRAILHLPPAGNSGISFQATTTETDSRNWRIRHDDYGPWGTLQFTCGDSNTDIGNSEQDVVMCMTKDRKVGIGTARPRTLLNVNGNSSSATDIFYPLFLNNNAMHTGSNVGGGVGIKFHMYDNGNVNDHRYSTIAGVSEAQSSAKTALAFYTNDDVTSAPNERMRIDNAGNVGIGTTSPDSKLHIKNNTDTTGTGDAFITGLTSNSSNRKPTECLRLQGYYNSSGSGALIRFTNYHASGSNPSNDEYNLAGIAGYDVKGDWGGGLCFYTAGSTIAGGDLTARMVIDNVGNVGIGTTSPGAKLEVKTGTTWDGIFLTNEDGNLLGKMARESTKTRSYLSLYSHPTCKVRIDTGGNTYFNGGNVGIGTDSPKCVLNVANSMSSDAANNVIPTGSTAMNKTTSLWLGKGVDGATQNYFGLMMGTIYNGPSYIHNVHSDGNTHYDLLLQPLGGEVGIGRSSTSYKLDIKCSGGVEAMRIESTSSTSMYAKYDYNQVSAFGDPLYLNYGTSEDVVLCYHASISTGNVGIGTSDPDSKLHVKGGNLKIERPFGEAPRIELIRNKSSKNFGGDDFQDWAIQNSGGTFELISGHSTNGNTTVLSSDGTNVGIGTTSPNYALSFGETVSTADWTNGNGVLAIFEETSTSKYFYGMGVGSSGSSINSTGGLAFWGGTGGYVPSNSNVHLFIKRDVGYVGIGETSPEAQLHIYSGTQCMRLVVPYNNKYFQTNFYYGGHHIDVYYHESTKGMGSSSNGGTLHLNYYSGGSVTINQASATSDDRLKHNEKIITNGLDIINQLEPKKYFKSLKRYDEDHNYDLDSSGNPITDDDYKIETGLIAQQVMIIDDLKYTVDEVEDKYKTVEKETLDENGDVILDDDGKPVIEKKEEIALKGRYTVKYQDIFVYNIAATQELDRQQQADKIRIADLEAKNTALENTVQTLISRITALENNSTN